MPPFVIMGLPRSRTKWLSAFLSHGDWHCGHDELQHMRSLDDVLTWFKQPNIGSVETAAAPFWRLLMQRQPDVRIVTVRRPVNEVLASVVRAMPGCDIAATRRILERGDRKLDQVEARVPGVLSVQFDDLAREAGARRVFEHCLGYPMDFCWWAALNRQTISGDLRAQTRYCQAYLPQMQKLARAAKHKTLASMARAANAPDGFTFQEEPFDAWYRDAVPLFRDHMVATEQDVDDYTKKNLPLLRQLDSAGAMQIMTCRSNGRMFGYLMAIISPTLDTTNALMAQFLPIFAAKEAPGIGMKLQRAAISSLRAKNVTEIFGRAGVRGSGPKLGAAYRRLGFEDAGQIYRLETSSWA